MPAVCRHPRARHQDHAAAARHITAAATSIVLMLVYLTLEVRTIFQGSVLTGRIMSDAEDYTYSAVWLAFGVALLAAGIVLKSQPARLASAAVVILTIAKVFLHASPACRALARAVVHRAGSGADGDRLALPAVAVPAAAHKCRGRRSAAS